MSLKRRGSAFKRLAAGHVQGDSGVLFNQAAQRHDGTQRLRTARIDCRLCPLAALFAQHRSATHPIAARGTNRGAKPPAPRQWLNLPGSIRVWICTCSMRSLKMRTQRCPSAPRPGDRYTQAALHRRILHLHITVPMHTAPGLLIARKEGWGQRLQMGAFQFKTSGHLFAGGAVDAFVGGHPIPTSANGGFPQPTL